MKKWLGVVAIGLTGCLGHPDMKGIRFDAEGELAAVVSEGANAWSEKTGLDVGMSADGIPVVFVSELEAFCGPNAWGCSYRDHIEILETTPRRFLLLVIEHEIGHVLRGSNAHATGNALAVMADPMNERAGALTAEDRAYVCEVWGC